MKKIVLIILSTLIITMLCGCTSMTFQGSYTVETYTDKETEQDYLIVISEHGVSITPRINKEVGE